jgi:hypothetical protein
VTQQWIAAAVVLVLAKLVGVGLTAFIFEATQDKLLQIVWFRRVYDFFIWARAWAHQKVDPIARRLRKWRHVLWHFHSGRFAVRFLRIRRRALRRHLEPASGAALTVPRSNRRPADGRSRSSARSASTSAAPQRPMRSKTRNNPLWVPEQRGQPQHELPLDGRPGVVVNDDRHLTA